MLQLVVMSYLSEGIIISEKETTPHSHPVSRAYIVQHLLYFDPLIHALVFYPDFTPSIDLNPCYSSILVPQTPPTNQHQKTN